MLKPKITIVTATYNLLNSGRAETFRQCVESVHNQTYRNVEHLVIDGASSDGTLDLIKEYEDKGWLKCFSEPDKGIYDAMNKGLAKATGDYIAFLNSDDYYHDSDGFSSVVEAFQQNPDATYVCSAHRSLSEEGKAKIYPAKLKRLFVRISICHQTMFTKTDTLKEFGGFGLRYKIAADYDLISKLALQNRKAVVSPLCFTTFREGGASYQYKEKVNQEVLDILQRRYAASEQEAEFILRNKTLPLHLLPRIKNLSNYLTPKDYRNYWRKSIIKTIADYFK